MQTPVASGTVVAGFRVLSLIGEGAMGAVYLAEDVDGGRKVALKLLASELARDERFRRRFLRETELAASLEHPHIVPTLASGEADGTLYLAMAYVEGSDLREVLREQGRLEPERALDLVCDVASALDAAHAAGLVHRDVKPGNILVEAGPDGEHAYVCDFGLARHVSSVSSLTGERGFVGTIDYVPPEQIESGSIDHRADVYSLGCVLFECLAGVRPFDRESELAVVFAHLNEPPPRLSQARPDLPEEFDGVFVTALAKSPDDRYGSCGELVQAARAALGGRTFVRRKVRARRLLLAAAALLVAAGGAVGGLLATGGGEPHAAARPSLPLAANALNTVDTKALRLAAHVPLGVRFDVGDEWTDVAVWGTSAWVLVGTRRRVLHLDLASHRLRGAVKLPWNPGGRLAIGDGSLWITQDLGPHVMRVDARTGKVQRIYTFPGEAVAAGVAYGAGSLWLVLGDNVARVDPRNGRVQRRFAAPARWLVFADGAVWAAHPEDGEVAKIDPGTNRVITQKLHGWLSDLAVGGETVWASVIPDSVVFRLAEDDLSVQGSSPAGPDPERLAYGGGSLWIANTAARMVSRLDGITLQRAAFRTSSTEPTALAYRRGALFVNASAAPPALPPISGQEIRISTPTDDGHYASTDPLDYDQTSQQILYATCANLLNYPDSAGPAGTRLGPEIAAAMPTVSPDGRTYTFRIRSGFRFSPPSNEAVTAQTFRHSLERELSPKNSYSPGPDFASDIAGVGAFRAGKTAHISGVTARGNTLSIRIAKPAGDFLTRISLSAFCPVPLSVPIHQSGASVPVPSAGPYYEVSSGGGRTVLLRNPNYHGSRPRQAERIVHTNNIPTQQAVALANAGSVDLLPQDFDNTTPLLFPGGTLDRKYGPGSAAAGAGRQQYYLYDAPFLDYIVFNTRRPLFRDERLRRAASYAVDRRALAQHFSDAPDDSIVPPAIAGFAAGRIYPLRPDIAAARRLAGTRARKAVLSICGDPRLMTLAQIVKATLAPIGIRVSVIHSENCPGRYREADMFFSGLGREVRDPESFIDGALAESVNGGPLGPGPWNRPAFRRSLENAGPLRGAARLAAYRRIERDLMRQAPFAVFGSFVWSQYLSPKVGCRVFQGEYGFVDLGALCKK